MDEVPDVEECSKRRLSFPECVLLRPKMYTINGTFVEIAAFLTGYYSGKAHSVHRLPVVEWSIFQCWLKGKLSEEFKGKIGHNPAFDHMDSLYPEEVMAREKLKAWLEEFIDGQYALKDLQKSYDSLVEDSIGKRFFEEMINKITEYPHKSSL